MLIHSGQRNPKICSASHLRNKLARKSEPKWRRLQICFIKACVGCLTHNTQRRKQHTFQAKRPNWKSRGYCDMVRQALGRLIVTNHPPAGTHRYNSYWNSDGGGITERSCSAAGMQINCRTDNSLCDALFALPLPRHVIRWSRQSENPPGGGATSASPMSDRLEEWRRHRQKAPPGRRRN